MGAQTAHVLQLLPRREGGVLQEGASVVHVYEHSGSEPEERAQTQPVRGNQQPHPDGTMMIGMPPSFSLGGRGGGIGLCLGACCGAACGGGAAAGGSATGIGIGIGCVTSARKDAFVSMPSSSTSLVPSRSCQKRCSCTSLYLHTA